MAMVVRSHGDCPCRRVPQPRLLTPVIEFHAEDYRIMRWKFTPRGALLDQVGMELEFQTMRMEFHQKNRIRQPPVWLGVSFRVAEPNGGRHFIPSRFIIIINIILFFWLNVL